jgi:hypothetical protein
MRREWSEFSPGEIRVPDPSGSAERMINFNEVQRKI